jgi:hypothetical protein
VRRYRDQVAAALQALTILGPTRYAWLGRRRPSLPASLLGELDAAERRDYLVASLRAELYRSFYRHGGPVLCEWDEVEPVSPDPWLLKALSEANTGQGTWETGWTVERFRGEAVVAGAERLRVRVPVVDCRTPAGPIRPGMPISVKLPKELRGLSPGFYFVVSDEPAAPVSAAGIVRVYWNVGPTGAPALVRALTSRLNADGVPFQLKVADHPVRLERCDSAVLYLDGQHFHSLRQRLADLAEALAARLRPRIPAFTFEYAPGVGLAEDSGGGDSFGERRCGLLADSIVDAHERRITRLTARVDAVAARFAEDGVAIDAPYLEPTLAGRHVI